MDPLRRAVTALLTTLGRLPGARRLHAAYLAGLEPDERREAVLHLLRTSGGACAPAAGEIVHTCLARASADAAASAYDDLQARGRKDPRSAEYGADVAKGTLQHLERAGARLEGARVLELGVGYSLIHGLALHCHGAARYVGTDLFPILGSRASTYRAFRARLVERPLVADPARAARALERFDAAVDLSGEDVRMCTDAVAHHHPVDAARLPFEDGAFDIVLSNASFEHFRDPAAAARECARVLAPGGLGLHQVDLRDHRDFSRPLDFLTFTDAEWTARFEAEPFDYTNRLRRGELTALFEAAGHEVRRVDVDIRHEPDEALRARLQPRYRALPAEELAAVSVLFVLERRRPTGT